MKREELLHRLAAAGCEVDAPWWWHDIWHNPQTGQTQPIPRHHEIDDALARHIIKYLGIR